MQNNFHSCSQTTLYLKFDRISGACNSSISMHLSVLLLLLLLLLLSLLCDLRWSIDSQLILQ